MLLDRETLEGIESGFIHLQFRRWKRPTVKGGGTLLTAVGLLSIEAVDRVDEGSLTDEDARSAGFADLAALRTELEGRDEGSVYRIRLSYQGPDPRIALRRRVPEAEEADQVVARLDRLDARSKRGPWTRRVLESICARPGDRAADLAVDLGVDRSWLKQNVRKLKGLGLTESLEVGYRLSPRGVAVLERVRARDARGSLSPGP